MTIFVIATIDTKTNKADVFVPDLNITLSADNFLEAQGRLTVMLEALLRGGYEINCTATPESLDKLCTSKSFVSCISVGG